PRVHGFDLLQRPERAATRAGLLQVRGAERRARGGRAGRGRRMPAQGRRPPHHRAAPRRCDRAADGRGTAPLNAAVYGSRVRRSITRRRVEEKKAKARFWLALDPCLRIVLLPRSSVVERPTPQDLDGQVTPDIPFSGAHAALRVAASLFAVARTRG